MRPRVAFSDISAFAPAGGDTPAGLETRDAADRGLLEQVRAGDVGAFETLYKTYHQPLLAFARSYVGSPSDAEEVVQDLMCRLWEQRAAWHVQGTVRGYLYLAVRNRIRNHARRERLVTGWLREAANDATVIAGMNDRPVNDTEVRAEGAELMAVARRAIEGLPPRCQRAYVLRYLHHLPRPEIADVMGISLKGVEIQLTLALKRLRVALRDFL